MASVYRSMALDISVLRVNVGVDERLVDVVR
jgi:hypothetical protein